MGGHHRRQATRAIAEFEEYLFACWEVVRDPLEQLAVNMRLFARLPDSHPRLARILRHAPDRGLAGPRGYSAAALEHVRSIVDAGLAPPLNLDLALMTTVASTERLMLLRAGDPTRSADEADDLAVQNLGLFGISRSAAIELVSRPLPDVPVESTTTLWSAVARMNFKQKPTSSTLSRCTSLGPMSSRI